jgi:hypothetical protein
MMKNQWKSGIHHGVIPHKTWVSINSTALAHVIRIR